MDSTVRRSKLELELKNGIHKSLFLQFTENENVAFSRVVSARLIVFAARIASSIFAVLVIQSHLGRLYSEAEDCPKSAFGWISFFSLVLHTIGQVRHKFARQS